MATLNYITIKVPNILFKNIVTIQKTPNFNVCKYTQQPGIIFRIPHQLREGQIVHCFIEHEVNLSNTLKTGTLTLKVQCTMVPVTHGIFSGFNNLEGTYKTRWFDEGDCGQETFVPDYKSEYNEIFVAPLPIGIKSNLYEYLNEILFKHCDDADMISKYAVDLGCQKETVRKSIYIPAPELNSDLPKAKRNHISNIDFFKNAESGNVSLMPENRQLDMFR